MIRIPLISIPAIMLSLIFVLMRITNIIDWSPLWLLSPLWIPIAFVLSIIVIVFILHLIVSIIICCYK